MTRRSYLKILVMLFLVLFAICLFIPHKVHATTSEEAQKALDLIPNEIYLDIPEIEYKKSNDLVKEEVLQIWKDNNISIEGIDFNIWGYQPFSVDYFYKGGVNVSYSNTYMSKTIKINYNNTNNKNSTYENYIKNLKMENPDFFEVDISEATKSDVLNVAQEYYKNLINDKAITIYTDATAGGSSPLSHGVERLYIMLFKEGNLYDIRSMKSANTIGVITVPSHIPDNEFEKYTINLINNYLEKSSKKDEFTERAVSINEGIEKKDILNGYTINYDNGKSDYVIIRKEANSIVHITDNTTNIKIDTNSTVIPANTKLVAKEIKTGKTYNTVVKTLEKNVNKFVTYDITLMSDNVEIQPNGKVKVSIPVPEGLDTSRLTIFRINDDGTKIEYSVTMNTVDNIKYATFETDHFSTYVLAEKANIEDNTQTEEPQETTKEHIKDETPKTGSNDIVIIISSILSILSIAGIAIVKKF